MIAYKQPATVPEINEIRGVNVGGVIKTLLEKRLITTAGRKEVIGRPILYRTSKQFLMRFGLSDLDELPSLKEFEQLAQAALGSDEGIAPTEPDDAAQTRGEVTSPAELSADTARQWSKRNRSMHPESSRLRQSSLLHPQSPLPRCLPIRLNQARIRRRKAPLHS